MVRFAGPPPTLYEALIAALSIFWTQYFPEFLRVSLTAGHSALQGTLNTSWCVPANAVRQGQQQNYDYESLHERSS